MEFSITKKSLLDCLSHFQSVVERRNTIPILSNLKISVVEGGLSLTATDLALELSESLTANVKATGGITIPSQLFFEIIRKAPESSQISLKQDDKSGSVIVFFGKSKFSWKMQGLGRFRAQNCSGVLAGANFIACGAAARLGAGAAAAPE